MSKKPTGSNDSSIPPSSIRILKISTCPSLSELSTLTYHVGSNGNDILIRVFENSSSGYFCKDWVSLAVVLEIFDKQLTDKPLTSFAIRSVYAGKSINSPGFLFAALKKEGFVQALADESIRGYELGNPEVFFAEIRSLMESGVALPIDEHRPKKKPGLNANQKKAAKLP